MPATPGTSRKSGRGRRQLEELPDDLLPFSTGEKALLCPASVFPKVSMCLGRLAACQLGCWWCAAAAPLQPSTWRVH